MSKLHTYTATSEGDGMFLGTVTAGSTAEAKDRLERTGLTDFSLKKA